MRPHDGQHSICLFILICSNVLGSICTVEAPATGADEGQRLSVTRHEVGLEPAPTAIASVASAPRGST